ncbi:hypothetical protein Tco_0364188 [Tanacetum coccineum]
MADMVQDNLALEERLDKHGSILYKLENLDIPHQVSKVVDEIVTDAVDWAIQAPLRDRFRDLPEAESKETRTRTHIAVGKPNPTKLMKITRSCPSGTSGSSGASGSFQLPPPPPPPPSTNPSDQSKSTTAPSSSKTVTSAEYTAWTTNDTWLKPYVHSSDDEDIGNDHIPKVNLKQDWWKPLSEEDRPATSTAGITELTQKDLEGPAFEIVKIFHPNVIHLQYQMEECHKLLTDQVDDAIIRHNVSKPPPLGGQPGQSHSRWRGGSISPDSFLSSILLLVVMVVIVVVMVILVVVVVAIIGVVIVVTIIGAVVVGGVPSIIKLSFVIVVQAILSACSIPIGWANEFHQDKASSVRVPVANFTLQSSVQLLRENTDSVRSNQRMRPTTPFVPLKLKGWQLINSL